MLAKQKYSSYSGLLACSTHWVLYRHHGIVIFAQMIAPLQALNHPSPSRTSHALCQWKMTCPTQHHAISTTIHTSYFPMMQVFRPNETVSLTACKLLMHRGDIREAKADINARVKLDGEPHFCPLHVPWTWRNSWSFLKGHFLEE